MSVIHARAFAVAYRYERWGPIRGLDALLGHSHHESGPPPWIGVMTPDTAPVR